MRHGFYVWSRKNYPGAGAGLLDRVTGWFMAPAGKLAANDAADVIYRTRPALVVVKTRDGRSSMNDGFVGPVLDATREVGGEVGIWAYVYPWNPSSKDKSPSPLARTAYLTEQAQRIAGDAARYGAKAVVLNAEKEWFHVAPEHVTTFVRALRMALAGQNVKCSVDWSSYAMPSAFPGYPWQAWCSETDRAWPQVYSAGAGASADAYAKRAARSAREHNERGARRIVFGGPLYRGAAQMRAMVEGVRRVAGTITPPWAGATPCVVEDLVVWWSMDQITEDRERVILGR